MLHRVRSELHARSQSNQDLLSSIQERLAQHSSQLMDLRDALNEAVNKTRQTEDLNSLNRNNLEESQVDLHHGPGSEGWLSQPCWSLTLGICVQQKSQELQKQHALVQENLQMAKDALAQVSDFLQMMERAKEVSGRGTLVGAEGEVWQPSAVTSVLAGLREAGGSAGWGKAAPH